MEVEPILLYGVNLGNIPRDRREGLFGLVGGRDQAPYNLDIIEQIEEYVEEHGLDKFYNHNAGHPTVYSLHSLHIGENVSLDGDEVDETGEATSFDPDQSNQ